MLIEYQNTKDDLKQLALAVEKAKRSNKSHQLLIAGVTVVLTMPITWLALSAQVNIFDLLFPYLIYSLLLLALAIIRIIFGPTTLVFSPRSFLLPLWLCVLMLVIWLMLKFDAPNGSDFSHMHWELLRPHWGWLIVLIIQIGYASVLLTLKSYRYSWKDQPSLNRKQTVDISVDGIVVTDTFACHNHRWQSFVSWQEIGGLFLVFTSPTSGYALPKRAFHGDEELNAFRAMARAINANRSMGFAVGAAIPVDSVAAPNSR